jgi:DnaD/phage-associated family protein
MAYIDYLSAFNRWLDKHPLPAAAQLLYYRLLDAFDLAGWPEQAQLDTGQLARMIGASDRRSVYKARDALAESGLISYSKGSRRGPGNYHLELGVWPQSNEPEPVAYAPVADDAAVRRAPVADLSPPPTVGFDAVMEELLEICPHPSRKCVDTLRVYADAMGADVCMRAMEIAHDNNALTWPYVRKILSTWCELGVTCLDDIERLDKKPWAPSPYALTDDEIERIESARLDAEIRQIKESSVPPAPPPGFPRNVDTLMGGQQWMSKQPDLRGQTAGPPDRLQALRERVAGRAGTGIDWGSCAFHAPQPAALCT